MDEPAGAGDSGKSTVAKQMQILHLDGFSHDELVQQKPLVYFNIIDSCQKLINAARNFGLELPDDVRPLASSPQGW